MTRLFLAAALAAGQLAAQTVFTRAFSGITTAQTSAVMPNTGQASHMLTVICPTAVADVTASVQVRIEGTLDGTTWIPISPDITTLTYSAELQPAGAYAITRANGTYNAVRVRAVQAPAGCALTVYYTGGRQPLGPVTLQSSRYLPGSPAADQDKVTWGLCIGSDCAVASNITANYIVTRSLALQKCYIAAKTAPTGAGLRVDVNRNGTSVFSSGFTLAAGSTYTTTTTFATNALVEGDLLTVDIEQVGSTVPGKDVTLVCTLQ
jgi:hypothetical protein